MFLGSLPKLNLKDISAWREKCLYWKRKWPMITEEHNNDKDAISKFGLLGIESLFSRG